MCRPRGLFALAIAVFLSWLASCAAYAQQGETYTPQEIRETSIDVLFERLAQPEPGRNSFAALWALTAKAQSGGKDAACTITRRATDIIRDRSHPAYQRWQCCYVLSGIGDPAAIPVLAEALQDPEEVVRGVAACALGVFDAKEATTSLKKALETETSEVNREWIRKALSGGMRGAGSPGDIPKVSEVDIEAAMRGERISLVLVKDFLRIENTGKRLRNVEFERYAPAIDAEQFIVARYLDAVTDSGERLGVKIASVEPDPQVNLIHTFRLSRFPEHCQVTLTITSLVARRERPAPQGKFPIPAPEDYPEEIRQFLRSTPMVAAENQLVQTEAKRLSDKTRDALEFAIELAALMRGKSYEMDPKARWSFLPTAANVLKYGGSCCGSAVAAAGVFRAAGIPAQITYCPAGYVHGIVRFYLQGYGWVRMDATCGVGKLPLVQDPKDLGLVRLYDMPIEMEKLWSAYAWPYHNNDLDGPYRFRVKGRAVKALSFASKDKPEPGKVAGWIVKPFAHLEPGSWNTVLGSEPAAGGFEDWDSLVRASREAVDACKTGDLVDFKHRLPALAQYVEVAESFGRPPEEKRHQEKPTSAAAAGT